MATHRETVEDQIFGYLPASEVRQRAVDGAFESWRTPQLVFTTGSGGLGIGTMARIGGSGAGAFIDFHPWYTLPWLCKCHGLVRVA